MTDERKPTAEEAIAILQRAALLEEQRRALEESNRERLEKQILLEIECKALEQERLGTEQRRLLSEQRREEHLRQITQDNEVIKSEIRETLELLRKHVLNQAAAVEWQDEFARRLEAIEKVALLLLARLPASQEVGEMQEALARQTRISSLRRQLRKHHQTLNDLQEQEANYGLDVSPVLKRKIEHEQAEIEKLEIELRKLSG